MADNRREWRRSWRASRCGSAGISRSTGRWTGAPTSSGKSAALQADPSGAVAAGAAGRPGAAADERRAGRARGLYPPMDDDAASPLGHLARVRQMFADLPRGLCPARRTRMPPPPRPKPAAAGVPDYYAQDFHFQTGGYLTEGSARLYDVQVETLFMGAAGPMRRSALRADRRVHARARPAQGDAAGCGLRHGALPAPGAARLSGHAAEGRRSLAALSRRGAPPARGLRGAELIEAAAEKMPLADASADIVTSIFLYHELPPEVRRQVTAEIARVLKPGGLFVFIDSLQMGDKPGWDGLLEAFPHRFHEPYYRHYSHRRSRRHVRGRRPGSRHDHHAVPVQADGAAEAVACHPDAQVGSPATALCCDVSWVLGLVRTRSASRRSGAGMTRRMNCGYRRGA